MNRNPGIWGAAGSLLTIASSQEIYLAFLIALLVLGLPVAMRVFTFSLAIFGDEFKYWSLHLLHSLEGSSFASMIKPYKGLLALSHIFL